MTNDNDSVTAISQGQAEWDFSIATGCIVTMCLSYLAQIVRLKTMPLETRNRFTMTIWWSHFINLLMLETKEIIFVSISITD